MRLALEYLEDRTLLASYTAASASDLIHDITSANRIKEASTITLVASTDFLLTSANNKTDGPTGLPVISGNLTILGNGDTIERSTAAGTPAFRLFDVASGASLTLQNLTLRGGLAFGSGVSAQGGAIYSKGTLVLDSVSVMSNVARGQVGSAGTSKIPNGGAGQGAAGGGIYSSGNLTLENGTTISQNQVLGGAGGTGADVKAVSSNPGSGGNGGNGLGGGVFVAGGTVTWTGVSLLSNMAQGGQGGDAGHNGNAYLKNSGSGGGIGGFAGGGTGGGAFGGGLYVAGGTVTLTGVVNGNHDVNGNQVLGGHGGKGGGEGPGIGPCANHVYKGDNGGNGGNAFGGGLYVGGGSVTVVSTTVSGNTAQGGTGGDGGLGCFTGNAGNGGNGFGAGIYAAGGGVELKGDTVTSNNAQGSAGGVGYLSAGSSGLGKGGGLYIDPLATVCLDALTQITGNSASTSDNDIFGAFVTCP